MSIEVENVQPQPQVSTTTTTEIGDARPRPQSSLPPIASIEDDKVQQQPALPKASDPVQWPFEPFPAPPPDGYWLPKYGPPKPTKFRSVLPDIPAPPSRTFSPPLMALTYPPPPPLDERDPNWLFQMLADVKRQRAFLVNCLEEVHAEAVNAYAEVGLAEAELEAERASMQSFIDMVASVAGTGFVRRMLATVDYCVEQTSKGRHVNEAAVVAEEKEMDPRDESGYESDASSSCDPLDMPPTRGPIHG